MNKFYHYGDSFATCDESEEIFSKGISTHFGLEWVEKSFSGKSNYFIATNLIKDLPTFNRGDKVLIGFTFFTRGDFINKNNELSSMNVYYDDLGKNINDGYVDTELAKINSLSLNQKSNLLNYFVDYSWDYYIKNFKYLINPIINQLISLGVDVRYKYLKKNDLYLDGNPIEFVNCLPNELELRFNEGDFISYLKNHEWLKEESVHYKWDIQDKLADKIIELWNK